MGQSKVYLGDCIEVMKKLSPSSCDLIFADPPFNIGVDYDIYRDRLPYKEYYNWTKVWIQQCFRLLKDNGSIYIAIGDEFAAEITVILKDIGFHFRNWIIWYYTFGQNQRKKFNRSHTHILYFTKHKSVFKFNADSIKIPSARQVMYKDKRADPNGKLPDDVWTFPRVCGTFKERLKEHPCQMPEDLLERIVLSSSNTDDVVLDPFAGTGTTAAVSKKLCRDYITIEISQNYYEVVLKRLSDIKYIQMNLIG